MGYIPIVPEKREMRSGILKYAPVAINRLQDEWAKVSVCSISLNILI
ncbi:MAG: hypothetical protein AB4352_20280 [Hormoscilla sp.]